MGPRDATLMFLNEPPAHPAVATHLDELIGRGQREERAPGHATEVQTPCRRRSPPRRQPAPEEDPLTAATWPPARRLCLECRKRLPGYGRTGTPVNDVEDYRIVVD